MGRVSRIAAVAACALLMPAASAFGHAAFVESEPAAGARVERALRSVREIEEITSGPGSYARTDYRLQAPDRMALATNGGTRAVTVGRREWFRTADTPWTRRSYGSGIPFSVRRWLSIEAPDAG